MGIAQAHLPVAQDRAVSELLILKQRNASGKPALHPSTKFMLGSPISLRVIGEINIAGVYSSGVQGRLGAAQDLSSGPLEAHNLTTNPGAVVT